MFDNFRTRVALSLLSKKAAGSQNIYNVFSRRSPGIPVYTDLSIAKATREGYKMSLYVYRAVRAIVQSASGIPWIVTDNKTGETIPNHDFTRTWAKPNREFSGQDNMEYLIAHLKLVGNSIIQPLIVNGRPREFWICMPDMIHPIPSKIPGVWLDGYEVTETGGKTHTVPPETFIHFMQFNPGDPYWGIGDLMAAARTVDVDNEAVDTQKVSMQNRGTPDGVFVNESISTKDQWDEAVKQVREQYLPKDNRRAPWVIGGNTKWYQMSLTPVEMDYIQSRLRNLQDIAAAFGLDPWWLGDRSHSTYNNVNEAKKALYETVTIPLLDDIRSTLNLKIAPLYGEDITISYDLSGVTALRDDFGAKVTQAKQLWDMGVSIQQANNILKLGIEEFPGWDVGYLPFSVAPISSPSQENISDTQPQASNDAQSSPDDTAENIAAGDKLTGVQIEAAQNVIRNFIDGLIPDTVAVELLVAVGIDRDRAQAMIDKCKNFEPAASQNSTPEKPAEEGPTKRIKRKINNLTEEQKTAHWKRIDGRRMAWSNVVNKKVLPLYRAQSKAVLKAIEGKEPADMQSAIKTAIENTRPDWEKVYTAAYAAVIEDFGTEIAKDFGGKSKSRSGPSEVKAGFEFDPMTEAIKAWITEHEATALASILSTTQDSIVAVVAKGVTDAWSITDIVKGIKQFYSETETWKATRDARTLVASASGYGQREAAEQSGMVKGHKWISSRDDRVRESHADIDGETVPMDQAYKNGLMYPGDTSGDPGEWINCRCAEAFETE